MTLRELLSQPEFQTVGLPFAMALVVALLLRQAGNAWSGLGMIAGFLSTVVVVKGIQLFPLTTDRKIVVCGVLAAVLGLVAARRKQGGAIISGVLVALGIAALVWVLSRILMRSGTERLAWILVGGGGYVAWLILALHGLRGETLRAGSAVVALGAGTGVACVLGASALLGQYGIALAAGAAALLLLALIWSDMGAESALTYPAAVLCALLGVTGVVTARLPWIALPILACVPLAGRMRVPSGWPRLLQALVWLAAGLLVAGIAVLCVWFLSRNSGGQG